MQKWPILNEKNNGPLFHRLKIHVPSHFENIVHFRSQEIVPDIETLVDDIYFEITHLLTGAHFRNSIFSLRSRLQNNRSFYLSVLIFTA